MSTTFLLERSYGGSHDGFGGWWEYPFDRSSSAAQFCRGDSLEGVAGSAGAPAHRRRRRLQCLAP